LKAHKLTEEYWADWLTILFLDDIDEGHRTFAAFQFFCDHKKIKREDTFEDRIPAGAGTSAGYFKRLKLGGEIDTNL